MNFQQEPSLTERNQQLEMELTAKVRALEVEAALDRVRTVAMNMQQPDDLLHICEILYNELQQLGFSALRNTMINIHDDVKGYFLNYDFSDYAGKTITTIFYDSHPVVASHVRQIKRGHDAFAEMEVKGKELADWRKFRKENGEQDDPGLSAVKALYYYFYSVVKGDLGISNFEPLPEDQLAILKRFSNVFDLAYKRYTDITKAEAQAREARIEAALEKIRSRSLAMRRSDELKEVMVVMFERMTELNVLLGTIAIQVFDEKTKSCDFWVGNDLQNPALVKLPYDGNIVKEDTYIKECWEAKAKQEDIINKTDTPEKIKKYFDYVFAFNDESTIPAQVREFIRQAKQHAYCLFIEKNSSLFVDSWNGTLYSEEQMNVLKRVAKVFDQAYVRFLDLQKAEAQVKEAQIEAALERVRSRSMAMQKSEELKDVIQVVYEQFVHLNIHVEHTGFIMDYKERDDMHIWLADQFASPFEIILPYFDSPHWNSFIESKEKGEGFFANQLSFEEKNKFYQDLFKLIPAFPEDSKLSIFSKPGLAISTVLLENIGLYIENFSGIAFTDEENATLMRFGKVFQQTYTRFLDLQKAEAQAREARIEAALERTRTQSMMMQHSNELDDTLRVFHEQVLLLGIHSAFSFLWLPDENSNQHIFWAAWAENNSTDFKSKAINYPLNRNEPATAQCLIDWKSNEPVYSYAVPPDGVENYFGAWKELIDGVQELNPEYFPHGLYYVEAFMKYGCFGVMLENDLTDGEKKLLARFAIEFERTYTRFLDLQKAEAQAKEARIEAALERVRSRSMAMHKSDELLEAAGILFVEMQKLGIESLTAGYVLIDKEEKKGLNYTPDPSTKKILPLPIIIPHNETIHLQQVVENWKKGNRFFIVEMDEDETIKHQTFIAERSTNFPLNAAQLIAISPAKLFLHNFYFKEGYVLIVGGIKLSVEQTDIMLRFTKVFQQTYTRFLDLQKAEAQAREAQIEAALEKVRSRSLAMRQSIEIKDVVVTVMEKMNELKIEMNGGISLATFREGSKDLTHWYVNPQHVEGAIEMHLPYFENKLFQDFNQARQQGKELLPVVYSFEEKNEYFNYAFNNSEFKIIPGELKQWILAQPCFGYSVAIQKYSAIFFNDYTGKFFSEEENQVLTRFAKVFDQAYIRFLDLQKAEAQTRESQIELSLERVRAKTMAMHNSTDVGETAAVMVDELKKLGIETIRCGIGIMHEPGDMEVWTISTDESYKTTIIIGWLDMNMHPLLHGAFQSWRNKLESYSYELKEADLLNYYNAINNYPGYPIRYDTANLPKQIHHNEFHFAEGTLFAFSLQQLTETQRKIFKRFAGVFGQTYRRYLDLKKAEAQARQAKIEAAMEKVRARAMAMQKPDELVEVAELLRREMGLLGVEELETSSIYIHHRETGKTECWYAIKDVQHPEKKLVSDHMTIDLDETSVGKQMLAFYQSGKQQVSIPMQGDKRKEWINYCAAQSKVLEGFYGDNIPDRTYHLYKFSNGYMGAASPGGISAESWDLLRRATSVFSLAYTRFSDLQQAEAQAREAKIETALERVRSRTLAMQKSDELAETAAEVFRQLISLGIEPNRLYIGIVKEESGDMEMWATDEDGTHVGKKFMFNKSENVSVKKLFDGWKAKEKSVKVDMQGKELEDYFHYLNNVMHIPFKGGLSQKRRVQSVAYFSKGFIGMASPDGQGDETIQLLERFAAVFNLTFTRFNDLKLAEAHARQAEQDLVAIKAAREKAEAALSELQVTQKQLIQSEKMASLGELTAGIAHEIQNPLNFVNNFSEVSKELLDEMRDAIEKGDTEEAKEIMNDVIQNLEKINHHGKRAEGIVKGMLQHSRASAATKEPTDINKLADEYLRLAYHGLRAKDKSFNATLKTEYDQTTGNINIVPQDIGRVILNLITNAFYATGERRKSEGVNYEPTVTVTTCSTRAAKGGRSVEIKVTDNGGGIPAKIMDKIFQPFFTTKPTGQGTGLGLSLAYDIVKAHGGVLNVETKEGEGSTFTIQLPA